MLIKTPPFGWRAMGTGEARRRTTTVKYTMLRQELAYHTAPLRINGQAEGWEGDPERGALDDGLGREFVAAAT